ncbi:type I restriction enzyme HsdR N-terminal domain-containing protein [Flavobacterium sp. J372]|uniref:type I restriction enzyme HsdR N-terminal domain-containing protein n=1 Tax=Flavobacterium sp. J372 TaxID=2898436 RepID=UPI002150CEB7|nr:type I restriction enzyme HsdR N-terminal domain-containing protein [Flavobacterium sp. J372]MCR5861787.1 type I restriction enzyme HsdR N-terminal domain-containing protein [Flavobacterium sp. J372]
MFELKLNKHYPKVIGDLTLICNIRGRIISHTPEENIRQAIVSFLVKEKGYPKQNIEIEVPMSRFAEGASGRADIIIYNNQRDILCVIECKRPGEPITDNILEQVKRYDDILQAETICIVLGKLCYFFTYNELNECAVLATEFPTYKELDAKDICYSDNKAEEFKRIPFRKIKQTDIDDLIYDGIIGENTEDKYYPFLINLYNFFMEEDDRMKLDKIKDIGLKAIKYGNAGSGTFYGNYRSFLVNEKSIVSFFNIINDPRRRISGKHFIDVRC